MKRIPWTGSRSRRNMLLLLIVVSTLCGVRAAYGRECLNVSFPDQTSVEGSTLTLNGLGLRQATALKVNVYVAALYNTKTSTDANSILGASAPKQLILHFVRSVGRSDLTKAWDEGFEANAEAKLSPLKELIEKLKSLRTNMSSGDRLSFTYKPGGGVIVDTAGVVRVLSRAMISRRR